MKKFSFIVLLTLVASFTVVAQTPARRTGAAGRTTQKTGATPPATNTAKRPATPAASPSPAAQTPQAAQATTAAASGACGCELPLPEVLATVNGVKITKADISPQSEQQIAELQQQVVEARNRELDLTINSRLLEAEAKKRGIPTAKLLEQEVVAKAKEPTDAEVLAFFNENKARIQEAMAGQGRAASEVTLESVKQNIVEFLRDQRQRDAAKAFADTLRAGAQIKKLVPTATPPSTPAERARVLATVNGQNITSGEIEDTLRPLIYEVQRRAFELRKRDVDLKINDMLLEQEARKRQVTTSALLQTEVAAKVPTVTESQAQTFYNQNKSRISGEFAQIKEQIVRYLQESEEQKAQQAFAERLRNAASIQVFITPPEQPAYQIATDDQPAKGSPTAPVTVVEFTDFQCPSCAQAYPVIERIATEYADRVRVVVRDFPLSQHENAFKAAEAAEAAREQGKYWEYAALLFRNQTALEVPKLKEYASQIGLDRQKFDAALDSGRFAEKVQRDLQDGNRIGVNSTPSLYVNGRFVNDRSYEGIKASIEAALKSSARK